MSKSREDIARQREEYVVLSNQLIRQGNYDLTAQQLKIILYIISKIRPNDDVYTWYTIRITDLCRCCGLCVQVCPTGALTATYAPEDEDDRRLTKLSHDFYDVVDEWNKGLDWIVSPEE